MHVSLDSALGRQRRLNSVGESVLQIAPNAAAAYSLRSLTGGDPKVVRVRRKSDNAERDFTASGVTSGALVDFVNEDVTIYQSDYSADANGWSGSTSLPTGNHDGVSDSVGTSKDNVLKLVKQADSQGFMQRTQGVAIGCNYTVSGSFLAPASNTAVDGILVKDGVAGSSLSNYPSGYLVSDGTWTDFSFSYTATVKGLQRINMGISSLGSNPNGSSTGSAGDIVYIADLKFVETTSNGFVETWYDQSGTVPPNDAIQTTANLQPKIVDAGVFQNGLKFDSDGSSSGPDFRTPISSAELTNDPTGHNGFALVWVGNVNQVQHNPTNDHSVLGNVKNVQTFSTGTIGLSVIPQTGTVKFTSETGGSSRQILEDTNALTPGNTGVLFSSYEDAEAGFAPLLSVDGSVTVSGFTDVLNSSSTNNIGIMTAITAGNNVEYSRSTDGICKEVLLYTGDQLSKRAALETNIAAEYGITLS